MFFENVLNPHTFVRYWYEIRDILVPILHDVKFSGVTGRMAEQRMALKFMGMFY